MTRPKGLTILEVLVALIILAIVLPGLANMVITSRKAQVVNYQMEQAFAFAQQTMDSVSLIPNSVLRVTDATRRPIRSTTLNGTTYYATTIIDKSSSNNITIQVSWNHAGKSDTINLTERAGDGMMR